MATILRLKTVLVDNNRIFSLRLAMTGNSTRYWLAVACLNHTIAGQDAGIAQLGDGKHLAVKNLNKGANWGMPARTSNFKISFHDFSNPPHKLWK